MLADDDMIEFFMCPLTYEMLVDPVSAGPDNFIVQSESRADAYIRVENEFGRPQSEVTGASKRIPFPT